MDINKCHNCQKQFDQDKRLAKQLPCGCVSCLKCYKTVFQLAQENRCKVHQQVYNINPEELQAFVLQEQILQVLAQPQEQYIDQEQIALQVKLLQDQYVKKQNHNRKIMEVIQDSSQLFQHIQSLAIKEIHKSLIAQTSISKERIKNLLQRLSEFQAINKTQYQEQALALGQQDPHMRQNPQGYQYQKFQQILREIDQLKKDQWMDVQILRVRVQRCMFNMFVYLSESSKGQLMSDREAQLLVKNYFKQVKVQNSNSQGSNQLFQQKNSFSSQSNQQQPSQQSQNIEYYQQQTQLIDKQQCQDTFQLQYLWVSQEISLQEKQVNDARLFCEQIEQKLINLSKDIGFSKHECQLCQEQAILLKYVSGPPDILTLDNLVQFLNKIKYENVSIQALQLSPLNKSGLIEQLQILQQLTKVTDQQICLKLIQIIQLSKNQPKIQQAVSNSLTILNYMNHAFTNIDLSNLNLSNSDLSDTTFTSCKFTNSNLTKANLRNTKFLNCDLSNANLTCIITEHPHIFTGHSNTVTSVSISSDSNFIVSGSYDYTVRLWDVKTGTSKTMSGQPNYVTAVAISRDSKFIVSGSDDCTIILWDVKTGTCKTMSGHTDSVRSVAISSDSLFIVSGSDDKTVRLWDVKTGTSKTMSDHTDYVYAVSISSDSQFIVSGSDDRTIILWDVKTGTCKTMSGHTNDVTAVAISRDSEFIVSGSLDETVRLWSTETQECIKVLKGHTSYVTSVIFSSNSKHIISGSYDKTIRIWDVQSGQCELNILGHTDSVGSLSLSKDNNWLVSSNGYSLY